MKGKPFRGSDPFGNTCWYLNGKLHREDGPAVEHCEGTKSWWINGERHREDGPAIEWANGDTDWYFNGHQFPSQEEVIRFKQLNLLMTS